MLFEQNMSLLYSDTQVSDVFITEYLPSMDSVYVKVYLYSLFLGKYNKQAAAEDIAKKLDLDVEKVKEAVTYLESVGIMLRKNNRIVMADLKEKEIHRLYRPKTTSSPEEAVQSAERNKKRNSIISAINNAFFQGVMSPAWYTDIDSWFDKYHFEEDVMYSLFQHCYDHHALSRQYITTVADSWMNKGIKNSFDLDKYFIEYQQLREMKAQITKKLNAGRRLTEIEELLVEKWVFQFNFSLEIIDLAFKEAVGKRNPFRTVDTILTDWHEKALKSVDEVKAHIAARAVQKPEQSKKGKDNVPRYADFDQRNYDKDYFEKIYKAYDE